MTPPNETHEVFANPPLTLAVVEVRLPGEGDPGSQPLSISLQRSFRDLLGSDWVIDSVKRQHVAVAIGREGSLPPPVRSVTVPRFTVRDRTLAVAVTGDSVTIETTRYGHYAEFRSIVEKALGATAEILAPDGVARVGMRYINEIRVEGIGDSDASGWQAWVDTSVLAPRLGEMCDKGFVPTIWEGVAQYQTGLDQKLVLRYGPRTGFVVGSGGPLKRPRVPLPGPLFVLDFDSFWEPAGIPEFDTTQLIRACDELRKPIRALFDLMLTDRLLAEFRKKISGG